MFSKLVCFQVLLKMFGDESGSHKLSGSEFETVGVLVGSVVEKVWLLQV